MDTGGEEPKDDVASSGTAPGDTAAPAAVVTPVLPPVSAKPAPPMTGYGSPADQASGSSTWYRTDQQRYKSVYRRANPWYRRIGRGTIALGLLAIVGGVLYFGAKEAQDYFGRDKLPSPGQDAATFASTSFLVSSSAPAPELKGVYTFDIASGGFDFVGDSAGPQAGVEIVSPDGSQLYIRRNSGTWRNASTTDPDVGSVVGAVPYLLSVDDPDDVLVNRLRQGYVDLVNEVTIGTDPDAREEYEMEVNTRAFAADYPLQWQDFQARVVPGISESSALPLTIRVDGDGVVVLLADDQTNWGWERLAYSDLPGEIRDPSSAVPVEPVVNTPATTLPTG